MTNLTIDGYSKKLVIHNKESEIVLKITPEIGTALCQMIQASMLDERTTMEYALLA